MGVNINKVVDIVKEREAYSIWLSKLNHSDRYTLELCFDKYAYAEKMPDELREDLKNYAKQACEFYINKLDEKLREAINE